MIFSRKNKTDANNFIELRYRNLVMSKTRLADTKSRILIQLVFGKKTVNGQQVDNVLYQKQYVLSPLQRMRFNYAVGFIS